MNIQGLQKTTLLDYPGKVAATIFFGGCNFRCPFCHNALVVYEEEQPLDENEVLVFLDKRKKILDGVCITGGEPLLQQELPSFLQKIKNLGLLVKLDTNGSFPDRLQNLIEQQLVDYVAMDVKNAPSRYAETAGVKAAPLSDIVRSAELIRSSGLAHEFRTTVVRELHSAKDFSAIADWLAGDSPYFLQPFADSGNLICEGLHAPTDEQMRGYLAIVRDKLPNATIRGME